MESQAILDDRLRQLSELRGLPGDEDEVRLWLTMRLNASGLGMQVDSMGNLIVRRGDPEASGGRCILVTAHMDEVGLVVSSIDDSGLLRFRCLGGIDERILAAKPVRVGPAAIPGVIGVKPLHLQEKSEREQTFSRRNLYIDIGARNREDALRWVSPGESVTFDTSCEVFGRHYFKGKAFDDRAGCYLLLRLLTEDSDVPSFYAVFTVQEEVGLRGAGIAANRLRPDLALVLEATTCADIPGIPPHQQATSLGDGPVITRSDSATIADPMWTERLIETAGKAGIPWQWKRTGAGGNDAGRIHVSAGGIPAVSISVPCRYIHAPVSVMHNSDLNHAYDLARQFISRAVRLP